MTDIKIFDDFLNPIDHERVLHYTSRPRWSFTGGGDQSRFWHMNDLEQELFFSNYLFKKIIGVLNLDLEIVRVYANGQTACQSGIPHPDDGDLTFLYYPTQFSDPWDSVMIGGLSFLDSNGEISKSIQYKTNRAVCFPAKFIHFANAPERRFNGLRVSVAWKLKFK